MNGMVPRTCTEISSSGVNQNRRNDPRPLEAFRSVSAYVLLGDPGSGKTTAFEAESAELGENACLITARNFLTLDWNSHPEWRDKTLFIDGLDEVRAGTPDVRKPFDEVRRLLDALGHPRFRISCREADWLGNNDRMHLESVSKDSQVTILSLNPLADSDIIRILNDRLGNDRTQAFIATARDRGVYCLLTNPQSLGMLTEVVVREGGWPNSRLETFEKACLQLVREHNEEHRIVGQASLTKLLRAAGRLCALQLISGAAGYTSDPGRKDQDYPSLDQSDSSEILRSVLPTKLFTAESNNRFIPVHRHIAEFLGARYLAQLVEKGLPARRAIGLITGADGFVVTEMRGLSAWFAAHCSIARAHLIDLDPIGVGLYGDTRSFSLDDKRALLKALGREGVRLDSVWRTAAVFGALATPDMEPVLKEALNDSNRNQDHQMFTDFVLRILRQGATSPDLSGILLKIVRDQTRWPRVQTAALDAFIRFRESGDKKSKLKAMLADIRRGSVSDPDNELLGTLLTQLYPQDLPPSLVWDYLSEEGNPELIGRHLRFWDTGLTAQSSDEQVSDLLDNLWPRLSGLRPALERRHLNGLPLGLLARGLKAKGDELDKGRLYDWLSVGSFWVRDQQAHWYGAESIYLIRSWLDKRPEVQKAVILEGLERCPRSDEFRWHAFNVQEHLYGADPPPDFGLWCLRQAVAMADTEPQVGKHLLELACHAYRQQIGNDGSSFEVLQEHAQRNDLLNASLARLVSPPSIPPRHLEAERIDGEYTEEPSPEEEQWLNHVRSNEAALRENRAAPALLHRMASEYFGLDFGSRHGPKAIEELLRGDQSLVDGALQGLRAAVNRTDVPKLEEILSLRENDLMHRLTWPFLAGLAEIERTESEDSSRWDNDRIRKALACYYCTPHGNYRPEWYRRLLETRPEVVAEVQVRFAVSGFRRDDEVIYKLWELAHDPDHAQVARHASLPLLRAFPIRCKLKQIRTLDHLLWAALQHADRASFREVIGRKLSRKRMNVAQRVYWLGVAVVASPAEYKDDLYDFVQGRKRRSQHLAAFFCHEDPVRFSFSELDSPALTLLIKLVGSYVGPDQREDESGWVTPTMRSSDLVRNLIQHHAKLPTQGASDALAELVSDTALEHWRNVLSQVQHAQRVIRRDAGYSHPDIEQVCRTLNNAAPANAADLAALVTDQLCVIAEQIRKGNTDDWRQYWNEDPHGRPRSPKHENSCRDAILSHLGGRLPQGVDAQPEGHYANDKRADIRVSCRDFQVPVEIKKNQHQNLWEACRHQLIEQYTVDSGTSGYGIYLVFWFGKDCTQAPPSGDRPDDPQELRERLKARLSHSESRKISVCVIDVSRDPVGSQHE